MSMILQPRKKFQGSKLWLDEKLFGHRFYDDQIPWLVLLEFLAVYISRQREGMALVEPARDGLHEDIHYGIPRRLPLRQILFNNPRLDDIERSGRTNAERWEKWLHSMEENPAEVDFTYLRERFDDFSAFVRVVEMFQNTQVEMAQRRWTSRFAFPYGPDCVYVDLEDKGQRKANDRRFFARSGELLYLMLNRSGLGEPLARAIDKRLLRRDDRWNRLARALMPNGHDSWASRNCINDIRIGYLPFAERPEYRQLAEDWLSLLDLDLPGPSMFDPLMRITGLNMLIYLLRRSHEEIGDGRSPRFVMEVTGSRRSPVFEQARDDYEADRARPQQAIEAHAMKLRHGPRWQAALEARDPAGEALKLLQDEFLWDRQAAQTSDPSRVFDAFLKDALYRHRQHLGDVHPNWMQRIGMRLARRGVGTWYAPSNAMLRALVLTTVQGTVEYREFLAGLYRRYGLVFGVGEADAAFDQMPADDSAFAENTSRLEAQLRDLGLLERLSDDCAYVMNPFRKKQ